MNYILHGMPVIPILIATLFSFLLGWVWYSALFGSTWMKALGKSKEDIMKGGKQAMFKGMGISLLQAIIVSMAIAHLFNICHDGGLLTLGMAIETAFVCWFAFVVMMDLVTRTYEQSSITLFYLHVSYRLFEFIGIALILFYMR